MRIEGLGTIRSNDGGELSTRSQLEENGDSSWPLKSSSTKSRRRISASEDPPNCVPVAYSGETLGHLCWESPSGHDSPKAADDFHTRLARRLALQVHRFKLRAYTERALSRELALIGASEALHEVEECLERVANLELPVLIEGEFGTEKLQVACAVHFSGPHREGPLVEICCAAERADGASDPGEWFERAGGGSLFLNGIDELHPDLLARLPRFLESRVNQWIGEEPRDHGVRVIASTTRDLRELAESGRFSPHVYAELAFLLIRLAGIRDRGEDIRHLGQYILHKHLGRGWEAVEPPALEAILAYDWPHNVFEMERVLARLAAMRPDSTIRLEDLQEFAPRLADVSRAKPSTRQTDEPETPSQRIGHGRTLNGKRKGVGRPALRSTPNGNGSGPDGVQPEQLAKGILEGDLDDLEHSHAGVRRALEFIGSNYQDEIKLSELAGAAHVSPSHLCYLFKSTLGVTFKTMLGMTRIEKAKRLLVDEPENRITDISLEVGFGDLSHFEKTFKRLVKVNPREYRRREIAEARRTRASRT